MEATSRALRVSRSPMATPTSAACRAGTSLTPSPVTATTFPPCFERPDQGQLLRRQGAGHDADAFPMDAARRVRQILAQDDAVGGGIEQSDLPRHTWRLSPDGPLSP